MSEDLEKVNESQALEEDPRGADNADSPLNARSPASWPGAVLLADEIRYYSTAVDPANRMIEPFRPEQLRPAEASWIPTNAGRRSARRRKDGAARR